MKAAVTVILFAFGTSFGFSPSIAAQKQIPTVRLETSAVVAAPPAKVWTYLTSGRNLVTWCPVWKSETNAKVMLTKVGDVLDFTDQWGNGGRSVVTYLAPNREIRIAHEPNDGSYMCQAKILIAADGTGTRVVYLEQYTDESSDADRKASAEKMETDMSGTLAALKAAVEKK